MWLQFIFPLYYMWEKATGTHDKPMWVKVIVRFPVGELSAYTWL